MVKVALLVRLEAKPGQEQAVEDFLKGGLAAWKAKGYPVVPYDKTFHLDTGT